MTVRTHAHAVQEHVRDELEHVREKQDAFRRFRRTVESIAPATPQQQAQPMGAGPDGTAAMATMGHGANASSTPCQQLRAAFEETIRPGSVADLDDSEPLLVTIREELGDDVATALSPNVDLTVTPAVKQAVLSALAERTAEIRAMERALETEATSLRSAATELDEITEWLVTANDTPLPALDFDDLRDRHESLMRHRETCDRIVQQRQERLHTTAGDPPTARLTHRELIEYLYQTHPVTYPVLATTVRLEVVLSDCQRVVRDHLTRRV